MYAVIFRAEINFLDPEYAETGSRLRDLAINHYGCTEFISAIEGHYEIAISYWPDLDSIQAWKENLEHQKAQRLGKSGWYQSYQVQVVEVLREYGG